MAWEEIEKRQRGGLQKYGKKWVEHPCASMCKTGITFNALATEHLLGNEEQCAIAINREEFKVRFKLIERGNERHENYTIKKEKGARKQQVARISNTSIAKVFPDFVGQAFRVYRTPNGFLELQLIAD